MYVRVVRFTDVSSERMDEVRERIEGSDGPPEGVTSTGIKVLYDGDAGTAVVIQSFDTEEDMRESAKVLEAMDASDTPGTRSSVDHCKLEVELTA
jgi:hypothetical protein